MCRGESGLIGVGEVIRCLGGPVNIPSMVTRTIGDAGPCVNIKKEGFHVC